MSDFPEPKSFVGDEDDRDGGFINRRTGRRPEPSAQYGRVGDIGILCDECRINRAYIGISHIGIFCSPDCATKASERHAAAMDPRRI